MTVIKNEGLRKFLRIAIPFVLIPSAALLGALFFGKKSYALVSVLTVLLAVVLFIAGYEKKVVGSRRAVLAAVMTALSVAGRFIPFFKPVTAITVLSGIYLGGETGFLVGALSAVLSNFYFGQGPWTPFQMLAWGLTGLFAGYLSTILKKNRILIAGYGAVSGLVFSLVMDVWTVMWYNSGFDSSLYLKAMVTALPHTIMYVVSNVMFLILLAKPFGSKLERIRTKYGV
jgi:energy-coupling factor transport system substrate-specific component